jgi:tetratricopeptide (TPR) repeat protein
MIRTMVKTALYTAVTLAGASLAWGQTGAFTGKVKGEDGKPLSGALIRIERQDMRGKYEVKTNKKGEYFYMGIPSGGNYNIMVFPSGKGDGPPADQVNRVRLTMGEPMDFSFDLQAIAAKRQAVARAAESGQVTQEMARDMTPEQKAAMEKAVKERSAQMAKNKVLNDAFNTAMAALQAKDFAAAVENFRKASEIDPKQSVIWANLAESLVGLSQTKTGEEQAKVLEEAVATYGKALEIKPDDAGMHNNLALALARQKKFPEARAELEKAAALDPANGGRYYYNLGAILTNISQPDPAMESFRKAIELDPNYADAHYQLAVAMSSKMVTTAEGKVIPPPGMKEALEKYLALKPDGPFAEGAKGLLGMLDASLETTYTNPNAPKSSTKKKK